jgi:hypothetical protein
MGLYMGNNEMNLIIALVTVLVLSPVLALLVVKFCMILNRNKHLAKQIKNPSIGDLSRIYGTRVPK